MRVLAAVPGFFRQAHFSPKFYFGQDPTGPCTSLLYTWAPKSLWWVAVACIGACHQRRERESPTNSGTEVSTSKVVLESSLFMGANCLLAALKVCGCKFTYASRMKLDTLNPKPPMRIKHMHAGRPLPTRNTNKNTKQ